MTYTENENNAIQLLKKRHDLICELLRVTNLVQLSGDEKTFYDDAEEYTFLMEKREGMFMEIGRMNQELESSLYHQKNPSGSTAFRMEADEIQKSTQELIQQIIYIDKANQEIAETALERLKKSIKGIKEGRNMRVAYQAGFDLPDGYLFDRKQ